MRDKKPATAERRNSVAEIGLGGSQSSGSALKCNVCFDWSG